jgi:hypothetical protein
VLLLTSSCFINRLLRLGLLSRLLRVFCEIVAVFDVKFTD